MKKLLAILLCVAVVLSVVIISAVAEDVTIQVWDGETFTEPQGAGTSETNPYLISTPAELAWMVNSGGGGKYFKLTNDIYLNDVSKADWYVKTEGYAPNDWFSKGANWMSYYTYDQDGNLTTATNDFKGYVDGDGHTVYGLYSEGANSSTGPATGLIPVHKYGEVKNLAVKNAYLSGRFSGAICGSFVSGGTSIITDCIADNIILSAQSSGGIVGYAGGGAVKLSGLASFNLTGASAGILGSYYNATVSISDSYTLASKVCTTSGYTASNAVVVSDAASIVGAAAKTSEVKNLGKAFAITDNYPLPKVFTSLKGSKVWGGLYAAPDAGETANSYLISSPEQLAYVVGTFGGASNTYVITEDIYLNDVTNPDWMSSSPNEWFIGSGAWNNGYDGISVTRSYFNGTIDGNGHYIYGLYNTDTNSVASMAGLIPGAGKLTIKNLALSNASVTEARCGGFVGVLNAGNATQLENCYVTDSVSVSGSNENGGMVGYAPENSALTFKNCLSETASGKGGILGGAFKAYFSASNCVSYSNLPFNYLSSNKSQNVTSIFTDKATTVGNPVVLTASQMQGDAAKTFMFALGSAFVTRENAGPMLATFADSEGEKLGLSGGDGSESNPFLISTAEDLYKCIGSFGQGKYYKLTNNIDLADFCEENGGWIKGNTWTAGYGILDGVNGYFYGTIDGDGYTVSGLNYAKGNTSVTSGLIPLTKGDVTVKNLRIAKSYITAEDAAYGRAGAIIGFTLNSNVNLENCVISSDVTVWGRGYASGGLIGYNNRNSGDITVNINNCAVLAPYSFTDFIASGITVNLTDTYFLGAVPYSQNNGTVVCTDVYTSVDFDAEGVTVLEKTAMVGTEALNVMNGLSSELWYAATKTAPILYDVGNKMGDVNMDGLAADFDDCAAIRIQIIGLQNFNFADRNNDNSVNVCDLVMLHKAL